MASKLSVGLVLEDENFRQRLADDAKEVQSMGNQTSSANQSLARMAQSLVQMTQKTTHYAKQSKQLTNTIIDLRANFEQLSEEEKNSKFGQDMIKAMDELEKKAAHFKDVADDTRATIRNMASDTAQWEALKQGIDVAKNSMQGLMSVNALVGNGNEKLEQTIKKIIAVETIANSAISIGNALQKQSALMIRIRNILTKESTRSIALNTAAQNRGTAATVAATVAQRIFNAVAKANPYVLLATTIIAVVSALSAFANKTTDTANKQTDASNKCAEFTRKMQELKKASETTSKAISNSVGQYKSLKVQFEALKTVGEKQQWLKDNIDKIHQLNTNVNNLNDAYDYFVKNSSKIIQAMTAIARATAADNLYREAYEEQLKLENDKTFQRRKWKQGDKVNKKELDANYGEGTYDKLYEQGQIQTGKIGVQNGVLWGQNGVAKLNQLEHNKGEKEREERIDKARAKTKQYEDKLGELTQAATKASSALSGLGVSHSSNSSTSKQGTTNTPKQSEIEKGEKEYNDALFNAKKMLDDGAYSQEVYDKKVNNAKSAYAKVLEDNYVLANNEQKALYVELIKDTEDYEQKLKEAKEKQDRYNKAIENATKVVSEDVYLPNNTSGANIKPTDTWKPKKIESEPPTTKRDFAVVKLDSIKDDIKGVEEYRNKLYEVYLNLLMVGAEGSEAFKKVSLELQSSKEDLTELQTAFNTTVDTINSIDAKDKLKELGSEAYSAFESASNSLISFADGIVSLNEQWEEMSGWERFKGIFQEVFSGVDTILEIAQAISTVQQVMTAFQNAQVAASTQSAAAANQEAAAHGSAAMAKAAEGVAGATSAGSSMPFPYNLVAIAAGVAAVMAVVATVISLIPKHANGGILGGSTSVGDRTLFFGNKGEMILNNRQQSNLFNLINHGGNLSTNGNGQVEFVIKGSTLKGVLNNYDRKMNKL